MSRKKTVGRKPKVPLKIAIDAGSLSAPVQQQGGIARICQSLVDFLPRVDRRNYYYIYSYKKLKLTLPPNSQNRLHQRLLPQKGFSKIWLPLSLKFDKPNVFLAISQYLPTGSPAALGFVYDLAFLQERFKGDNSSTLEFKTANLISNAKHIVTFSNFTKRAIIKNYQQDPHKISVLTPGLNFNFFSSGSKIFADSPYFLYVGAAKLSKNLPSLLKAFSMFLQETNLNFKLIIIGEMGNFKKIEHVIHELSLEKYIELTGYVSDDDLAKYYRGAYAFVSPALMEGFGFPVVEAMASGTPVIAGNNSAMKEVVGKSGILVDAQNTLEITKAMKRLVFDQKLYKNLSLAGRQSARKYNQQKFAQKILEIINKKILPNFY